MPLDSNESSSAASLCISYAYFLFSQVYVGSSRTLYWDPVQSEVFIHFKHGAGGDPDLVWEGHEPRSEPPTQSADRRYVSPACPVFGAGAGSKQTTAAYTRE